MLADNALIEEAQPLMMPFFITVGTIAARDLDSEALNYDQCFVP